MYLWPDRTSLGTGITYALVLAVILFGVSDSREIASDSVKSRSESASDPDQAKLEQYSRELAEESIRRYGPMAPEYIAYLERSYDMPGISAPQATISGLGKSYQLEALPVLSKVLLHNPRPIYRVYAVKAIGLIEWHHGDRGAVPAIVHALEDSVTDVQWNAAKVLFDLGETSSGLPVIIRMARGEEKENWTVDWEGYIGRLEFATEEEIEQQKKRFRDGLQCKAIRLLGRLGSEESISILGEIAGHARDDETGRCVREALGVTVHTTEHGTRGTGSKTEVTPNPR